MYDFFFLFTIYSRFLHESLAHTHTRSTRYRTNIIIVTALRARPLHALPTAIERNALIKVHTYMIYYECNPSRINVHFWPSTVVRYFVRFERRTPDRKTVVYKQ